MRGEVISIDSLSGDGLISGDDGQRYPFVSAASRSILRVGDKVDFAQVDGAAADIMVLASLSSAGVGVAGGYAQQGVGYNFVSAMFSFNGRLRRSHFWISWAILFFGYYVWSAIPLLNVLLIFALPVFLWANLAVGAKRFHDMGFSGWLIAIPWSVLVIGSIISLIVVGIAAINDPQAFETDSTATIMSMMGAIGLFFVVAVPVSLGFWLWLGIADSKPGRNAHGPNPKNPADDTANTFA